MWQAKQVTVPEGVLTWDETGAGEPLLFLHGGPGDSAGYMVPLAEPLTGSYRCLLLDQRGSGRSPLERLDTETLAIPRFYDDIEAVREAIGESQLTLVGHSWGAMLAIYYAQSYPQCVKRMILIGMGPLDAEANAVAGANILRTLSATQRAELEQLAILRRAAAEAQDWEAAKQYHLASINMRLRAFVYNPRFDTQVMDEFTRFYSTNPTVNRIVSQQARQIEVWGKLGHVTAPTLVLYGYQDFEPITQAYRLKQEMPNVTVRMVNEAGHELWLEQPEWVQAEIREFLTTS